jgi:hypothetical protein
MFMIFLLTTCPQHPKNDEANADQCSNEAKKRQLCEYLQKEPQYVV